MKRKLTFFIVFIGLAAIGQTSFDRPYSQDNYMLNIEKTDHYLTEALDINVLLAEDSDGKDGGMPRAGILKPTDVNMFNSGTWFDLSNGDKVWRLKMTVPNALAVNLYFDEFFLPFGGQLYAYSEGYGELAAHYTLDNNPESGYYATNYVHGETIILEYYEPKAVKGHGRVNIQGINGFYDMIPSIEERGAVSDDRSGSCQVDINCSEGSSWKKQRDAVVKIIVMNNGETGFCSGSLLNNTAQDCTPYILSAHHCAVDDNDNGASATDFAQWVFIFNFQKQNCGSGLATGFYSSVGAIKKANSHTNGPIAGSDYVLLEMNDDIDETKAPYFAGWDANNIVSNSGVAIHHPDGDFKKISTYTSTLTTSNWSSSQFGSHWRVTWIGTVNGHGVSEGGSSGSPIFNAEGLVIGQLSGGLSECNDVVTNGQTLADLYGKMSYNWNGIGNTQSLMNFLDPIGNGTTKSMQGNYYLCSQGNGIINGVDEALISSVKIYPNPLTEINFIVDLSQLDESASIELFNPLGEKIVSLKNQFDKVSIVLSDFEAGLYIVKITQKNGISQSQKLIKI